MSLQLFYTFVSLWFCMCYCTLMTLWWFCISKQSFCICQSLFVLLLLWIFLWLFSITLYLFCVSLSLWLLSQFLSLCSCYASVCTYLVSFCHSFVCFKLFCVSCWLLTFLFESKRWLCAVALLQIKTWLLYSETLTWTWYNLLGELCQYFVESTQLTSSLFHKLLRHLFASVSCLFTLFITSTPGHALKALPLSDRKC